MNNQLTNYDSAKYALSQAVAVDEVKDIRDKALAMAEYARQANDKDLLRYSTEIKIRAERKCGELLAAMEKAKGGEQYHSIPTGDTSLPVPTLADLGIAKIQSSRWQKLAAVPETQFESAVSAALEIAGEVTAHSILALGKAHVSNNSGDNEWYTPAKYIELARQVMGSIDTDPATSKIANKTVKAKLIYTADDDGLTKVWNGAVWLNPPYAQPLIGEFAEAVSAKFKSGEIKQAIILVNNATETQWFQRMLVFASAVCFPKARIKFLDPLGNPGAPLQGQAIIYMGINGKAFGEAFKAEGAVLIA